VRCLHLAETAQKPILVLCFNITLAARLHAFAEEQAIHDKVHVYHFHAWCKTQLQTYHVDVPQTSGPVWERQVEAVISAVDEGRIPRAVGGWTHPSRMDGRSDGSVDRCYSFSGSN
jgi:hypothetical protein